MPTRSFSDKLTNSSSVFDSSSDNKIIGLFRNTGDPNDTSAINRVSVGLKNTSSYYGLLSIVSSGYYQNLAGCDLSAMFMPFKANVYGNMPHFNNNVSSNTSSGNANISHANLMPFKWSSESGYITDILQAGSGDYVTDLISNDFNPVNIQSYRDLSDIRTIGYRLPMIGVGWGYTTNGLPFPSGSSSSVFRGDVPYGYMVDPKNYVAAPIDLRYDTQRNVWTSTTSVTLLEGKISIPSGHSDFTDNRYWVQINRHHQTSSFNYQSKWNPESDPNNPIATSGYVVVTNIAEHKDSTHVLPSGMYVSFYQVTNAIQDTGVQPIPCYVMSAGTASASGTMGTQQYQVYQMLTANVPGWEFEMSHP